MKTVKELKNEQYEAKAKLHELVEFINSEEFYNLPKSEQALVSQQRTGMELYLSSLTKRVYGNPKEPDNSGMMWLALMYGMFNANSGLGSTNGTYALKESLEEKDFESGATREGTV